MDPFRKNFLDHADAILKKKPSTKARFELLRLANPGLKESEAKKSSAFRTLQARLHPDKHPQDPERATDLFKTAKLFCEECLNPSESKHSSFSFNTIPFQFDAKEDKWNHLDFDACEANTNQSGLSEDQIATLVAYQCINARGAIAHGKKPGLRFTHQQILNAFQEQDQGVEATFTERGGCKTLESVQEIKEEVFNNGPVVSVSFCINSTDACFYRELKACVSQKAVLIVGWKAIEAGEVWLVQQLAAEPSPSSRHFGSPGPAAGEALQIAMGQFDVEEKCLAPSNTFENEPWEVGPYLDIVLDKEISPVWRGWPGIDYSIPTEQYMELAKTMGRVSFGPAVSTYPLVTVREKGKIAHSKRGQINWVEWQDEKVGMRISITFI